MNIANTNSAERLLPALNTRPLTRNNVLILLRQRPFLIRSRSLSSVQTYIYLRKIYRRTVGIIFFVGLQKFSSRVENIETRLRKIEEIISIE